MQVPDEVTRLIEGSGNSFHAKVARWFSANGWHVVVSPYYLDQTQGKAREIDLIAEKIWPIRDGYQREIGNLAVRLFIECKFVASHSVFWFADKDKVAATALVCSGDPFRGREANTFTAKHHYLSAEYSSVAKIFATNSGKSAENEPFYKALNQVLNAMVSMRGKPITDLLLTGESQPEVILECPVVVCSSFDKIYKTSFNEESDVSPVDSNFQLEVRYAYVDRLSVPRDEYFLLDFVEFSRLEQFMKTIDEDVKAASTLAAS